MWDCDYLCAQVVECGTWFDAGGPFNTCHCGKSCDDANPCTDDQCIEPTFPRDIPRPSPPKSNCTYEPLDGVECEFNGTETFGVCKDGLCVQVER